MYAYITMHSIVVGVDNIGVYSAKGHIDDP